jgi:hypothetical protein
MKVYYRPPKVKPSKKNQNKQLPEWDATINDLNKYKLSSGEIVNIYDIFYIFS